jgi:CheY-like chemotaxis protein
LRSTVWDALRTLAVRAHRKGLELVCHFASDVPDALVGDAGRLRQILLNIVGNAIKFTEQGEIEVQVSMHGEAPSVGPVTLRVSVRDTGIGIPPDKTQQIFRAFEQEDSSTTRRFGGTGLGLSIAANLVALMHGTIHVESEVGRGSTFFFTAKLERAPRDADVALRPPSAYVCRLPVLVVDGNQTNRRLLEECLRGWQMATTAVGDGTAAMEALWNAAAAGRPYALVLLDSRLPDTDGLSLVRRIRGRAGLPTPRIVLLTTGEGPEQGWRSGEREEIDAEWLKPIRQEDMLEGICQVLSRSPWAQRLASDAATEARSDIRGLASDAQPRSRPPVALRILIVDADEFSAMFACELLRKRNHDVTVVSNGRDAIALMDQSRIDLMLLDLYVADAEGFNVVRNIRDREHASNEHLPVIALAARSRPGDRDRCMAVGMDEFLNKPVRPASLLAAIDRVAYRAGSAVGTAR